MCLERAVSSTDVESRRRLAAEPNLPAGIFELLGADADDDVRLAVASRADCPLVVLQELERDDHDGVRAAATAGLSSAFAPRVLQEPEAGNLFSRAELDALGQADTASSEDPFGPPALGRASSLPPAAPAGDPEPVVTPPPPRVRRVAAAREDVLFSGIDEILSRLDALSSRLSSLESVLASTGERLGAINNRLDGLGDGAELAPPAVAMPAAAPAAESGSLLPVVHPAELGTGPVIRTDIVAAAWLAVLPLLARQRDRGTRAPSVSVAHDPVAGPFAATAGVAVAELLPARADRAGETPVIDGEVIDSQVIDSAVVDAAPSPRPAARDARQAHRRQPMHSRRRGLFR
ncbi:MAG TPA: hypothetical protein VFA84_12565 [Acidimicrobiales bacterium]|nr:hypothetical protein [Acidimicrobiales bacterium]